MIVVIIVIIKLGCVKLNYKKCGYLVILWFEGYFKFI